MAEFQFRLNPRAGELSTCSAVLNGRGLTYEVNDYRTTLSVKSVVRGSARYYTPEAQYLVTPDSFLILNEGQRYSLEFEGSAITETLCPFFQAGFLEQAADAAALSTGRGLDDPEREPPGTEFCERLYPNSGAVGAALRSIAGRMGGSGASETWLEDRMYELARALAALHANVRIEVEDFPGLRRVTRLELYRRLYRGRDFLTSCYCQPVSVSAAARAAALSPFHFQRMFKLAFGKTPMQFLQDTRLNAARRLLAHTSDAVTAICFAVGFESPGSFSWLFRKRFGLSPREFRARTQNRRIEEVSRAANS
ncbi:MAG: AraC family transcriptional regulator [Bryobacteraceae bacterium]